MWQTLRKPVSEFILSYHAIGHNACNECWQTFHFHNQRRCVFDVRMLAAHVINRCGFDAVSADFVLIIHSSCENDTVAK